MGGIFIKRPLALLIGIIISIISLSIMFPSDPEKPDIISIIKSIRQKKGEQSKPAKNNIISDIIKIDDSAYALTWSPDEDYLYYIKKANIGKYDEFEEIWISDIRGNKRKIYSNFKFNNTRDAKWSPDGTMLCFISNLSSNRNSLFIYNTSDNSIKDITPYNVEDLGVTSYDWDEESMFLVISTDIIKPCIDLYNIKTNKYSRIDIELASCKNVAFSKDGNIIFSDIDENFKYGIFYVDKSGKNKVHITDGQEFLLSPDRQKLAILSDTDMQKGLWIYDMNTNEKKVLSNWPVYNIYWMSDGISLLFSMEEDCKSKYTFKGTIYRLDKDLKMHTITGAVHTIFVSSKSGSRVAMTSPDTMEDSKDNKGVFIGQVYK